MLVPSRFTFSPEDLEIHVRIKTDRDGLHDDNSSQWKSIKDYRAYTKGKTPISLSEKQKTILTGLNNAKFCDNVCKQIIVEANGRINFERWECKNEPIKIWLDKFFAVCNIRNKQGDVHFRTLRDGNFVLALNWDNDHEYISMYKENWWNGTNGIFIAYDNEDEMTYAVKEWPISETKVDGSLISRKTRRVIWFEDHIEKWESETPGLPNSWTPSPLESDIAENDDGISELFGDSDWKLDWTDSDGNPLGIPYVHFINAGNQDGNYGDSELSGGVLGFQDQLISSQFSIAMSIALTGGQMYYGTGIKLASDPNNPGKTLPIEVAPGMFHTSANEKSTFGTLPAGDIDKQIAGYNLKLKRVAQMTGTPVHTITGGDWPSGDALLRAEIPAVSKAWKQINQFSDNWVRVATIAIKLWNNFSDEPVLDYNIDNGIIDTVFIDPERRDSVSRSIIVHNLAENVSFKESLRIMGYSKEKAEEVYAEWLEEQKAAMEFATKPASSSEKSASGSGGNNKPTSRPA